MRIIYLINGNCLIRVAEWIILSFIFQMPHVLNATFDRQEPTGTAPRILLWLITINCGVGMTRWWWISIFDYRPVIFNINTIQILLLLSQYKNNGILDSWLLNHADYPNSFTFYQLQEVWQSSRRFSNQYRGDMSLKHNRINHDSD